jgi:hypothetical protein
VLFQVGHHPGFGVYGLGFLEFRVSGLRVYGLWFLVQDLGFKVQNLGLRVSGFRVPGFEA